MYFAFSFPKIVNASNFPISNSHSLLYPFPFFNEFKNSVASFSSILNFSSFGFISDTNIFLSFVVIICSAIWIKFQSQFLPVGKYFNSCINKVSCFSIILHICVASYSAKGFPELHSNTFKFRNYHSFHFFFLKNHKQKFFVHLKNSSQELDCRLYLNQFRQNIYN